MMQTLNRLAWIVIAVVLLGGISFWLYKYTENERRIAQLEQERQHLKQIVTRLTASRRTAEMILLDREGAGDSARMNLLFVEYARDGQTPITVREFPVEGAEVHIDARVIRFERDFVFENDPLRGSSIALFTRLYGSRTAPQKGIPIDPAGEAPAIYKGADPQAAEFEGRLWRDFWRLLEDQDYAKAHGVRIAQGEGVWWPPQPGKLYTLSIAADGGIELKSEPVKAIYLEAMKKLAPATQAINTGGGT